MYFKNVFVCLLISALLIASCKESKPTNRIQTFTTSLGKEYAIAEPSSRMFELYQKAEADYNAAPSSIENIIWYGRRTAYLGEYNKAIKIYSEGIKKYPEESRLYRHRGHRYISIREFDKAIADLELASKLIEGTENEMEPDGMPNALGIPISSKHGNIWYHLGLAYYLKNDMPNAFRAYKQCRNATDNDDNIVSSSHWLYMIQRRIGNKRKADSLLISINDSMKIVENQSYYNLCLFYKGLIPIDSLIMGKDGSANDAIKYGIANWYLYNKDKEQAKQQLVEILDGSSWNSFGYIAAEHDYLRYFEPE